MEIVTTYVVPTTVFFVMWVVGLELTTDDFRRVIRYPKATLVGTATQLVLLPALASAFVVWLRPAPAVAAGLFLIAAAPGAAMSSLFTLLARGNTALAVTLTALSNVLAVVTMPVVVRVGFSVLLGESNGAQIPMGQMMTQLVFLMMIPIGSGMLIRAWRGPTPERYRAVLHRASFGMILVIMTAIAIDQRGVFAERIQEIAGLAALLTISIMVAADLVGRLIGCPLQDRIAFVMEFSARNVAIAIVVASTTLARLDYAVFIAAYFVTQMAITTIVIGVFRRLHEPAPA